MEIIKLSDFEKVAPQLRRMTIDENKALVFPLDRYKTVTCTIWRLKQEGMKYTTRSRNGNVYVWRIA